MLPGVGVFGTSLTARVIIPLLKEEGFAVKALWGRTPEEAEELAKEMSVPFYTSRIDEVLLHQDVDLVCINLPPPLTRQVAVKTLGERPPPSTPLSCLLSVPSSLPFSPRPFHTPGACTASETPQGSGIPGSHSALPPSWPSPPACFSPFSPHHLNALPQVRGVRIGGAWFGGCESGGCREQELGCCSRRGNFALRCVCSARCVRACAPGRGERAARNKGPEERAAHVSGFSWGR